MKKENLFQKYMNLIIRKKEEVVSLENNTNKKEKFSTGLRKFSHELNSINEIRANPSKLYDMSMEELNDLHQAIKKRQEFVNQRIFELKQQKAKKSDNI